MLPLLPFGPDPAAYFDWLRRRPFSEAHCVRCHEHLTSPLAWPEHLCLGCWIHSPDEAHEKQKQGEAP